MLISFANINIINSFIILISLILPLCAVPLNSITQLADSPIHIWPLPAQFTTGNDTLRLDPNLSLVANGNDGGSGIVKEAFERYRGIIFQHASKILLFGQKNKIAYDVNKVTVVVRSKDEELRLGVDESYSLSVTKNDGGQIKIEAKTIYGALRGLETFSQICSFDYETKVVQVYNAPWNIVDKPKFVYRGLMIDTSRHYLPIDMIKHVIESMSYAKLNVLHWHIIDKESFPLEVPTYPNLWKGSYTKWERYAVEDAHEIVNFAKSRGINVMAEVDVPGHAESWGIGYPDVWPSSTCKEPLDVSKNSTFDMISGILSDLRKIFPFELIHLGGDEVNTDCWNSTSHVKQWMQKRNMTNEEAYDYFVLRAQEIAISKGWNPVTWEETFNTFADKLNPRTVVHNWLGPGVCPKVVAKGFKCIYSNQAAWYLDHLDIPWEKFYSADPLDGITDASRIQLVLGGEVCMWGETADASNLQQTIWPRAAAAAERLWSNMDDATLGNTTLTVLPRYQYFRCLLNRRGVAAAPATNPNGRSAPYAQGSCYEQ